MSSSSSPVEHEDLWFEDGDVVMNVTEGGVEHRFRVHRSILAIASPVFRDMLSMPQPSGGQDLPISLLDAVQDVTALLGALYVFRKAQTMNFDVALGILHLSHKYQIEGLQDAMTQKLLEEWPLSRHDYVARLSLHGYSADIRIPQALKLIDVAQRCQASVLLPTAFYELACVWETRWEELARSLSLENVGRLAVGLARFKRRLVTFRKPDTRRQLLMWDCETSDDDDPGTIHQYHEDTFDRCAWPCPLYQAYQAKLSECMNCGAFMILALGRIGQEDLGDDVCGQCRAWFENVLANKAQELWESIPDDFNLPKVDAHLYSQSQVKML
ncbi:hypothetical protein JB92DRAFT_3123679 [Gautieria morchelliformis]|nr:hypothetical protein JB92DRAFT_3123679 [Gautieria morchelliformis]